MEDPSDTLMHFSGMWYSFRHNHVRLLKFNVDGAVRGKLGTAGIRGVLLNDNGKVVKGF